MLLKNLFEKPKKVFCGKNKNDHFLAEDDKNAKDVWKNLVVVGFETGLPLYEILLLRLTNLVQENLHT